MSIGPKFLTAIIVIPVVAVVAGIMIVMRLVNPPPPAPATPPPQADVATNRTKAAPTPPQQPQQPVTAPATRPPVPTGFARLFSSARPPPPPPVFGSVSGSAWITRKTGGSDLLRGMHVYLLQTSIPTAKAKAVLADRLKDWAGQRSEEEKMLADEKAHDGGA